MKEKKVDSSSILHDGGDGFTRVDVGALWDYLGQKKKEIDKKKQEKQIKDKKKSGSVKKDGSRKTKGRGSVLDGTTVWKEWTKD